MLSMLLLLGFGLGVLLLPQVLVAVVTVLQQRLAAAIPSLAGTARQALQWGGNLLTNAGALSPTEALSQVVGAIVLLAAGVLFAGTDVLVTLATLAPLLGTEFTAPQGLLGTFDTLMGFSLVLLAVVFGFVLSDLLSWTGLTRFALITRARAGAFCLALGCFGLSALVVTALAWYRAQMMLEKGGTEFATEVSTVVWMQTLPAVILIVLPLLLFIGVAVALTSLHTCCEAVIALLVVVGGCVVALLSLLLRGLDLGLALVVAGVTAVPDALKPLHTAGHTGLHRLTHRVTAAGGGLLAKLRTLVQPHPPRGAARATQVAEATRSPQLAPVPAVLDGQHGPAHGDAA